MLYSVLRRRCRTCSVSHLGVMIWWPIYISRSFWHSHSMWNSTAFSEKRRPRSESRSQRSRQKYQYFEWVQSWTSTDLKLSYSNFQYIICEPFRSWKELEGVGKLDVKPMRNLAKIQMSPKHVLPPGFVGTLSNMPRIYNTMIKINENKERQFF